MFRTRPRAEKAVDWLCAPSPRRLALIGSAAGVVVVAAGVAILATAGGPDAGHARQLHPGAATVSVPTAASANSAAHVDGLLAAYPPRTPCSLTLVQAATGTGTASGFTTDSTSTAPVPAQAATLEGSGLGSAQTVTVIYYPGTGSGSTPLGDWRTHQDGSFDGSVRVPDTRGDSGYVTARSQSAQCSTPAGPSEPGYPPSTGSVAPISSSAPTSGSSTAAVTSSAAGPTGGSSTTTGTQSSGAAGGSGGAPPNSPGSTDSSVTGTTSSGTTSSGAGASSGAPTSGSATSGNGSVGNPGGSTTPGSPTASPTDTPAAISAQSWGLPTSFIVTMALVLLVLGGLAVLVLTRRSG